MLNDLWIRVRALFRRKAVEGELDDELRFHFDQQVEKLVQSGLPLPEARRRARLLIGGSDQIKEDCRDERGTRWLGDLWQDIHFAVRMLRKNPGFTAVAVFTLALGIGANTAIFSLIDTVMLKSLPVYQPERLLLFGEGRRWGFIGIDWGEQYDVFSYPLYEHLRDHNPAFQDICAFRTELDRLSVRPLETGAGEPPQLAWGKLVSGNYFSVLGVHAARGRVLSPEDDHPEASPAAVMSYGYWNRRFNLDPSVVGRPFDVNGITLTVVGVASPEFFGESVDSGVADFWLPITLQPGLMKDRGSLLNDASVNWLYLLGRLRPGVSSAQARAVVNTLLRQFLAQEAGMEIPEEGQQKIQRSYIVLSPGARGVSHLRFQYSLPLRILMGVVALVLLIACGNVANILLSRAAAREREIAMRFALGAGRVRVMRQLLTESLLLAVLGGVLGVFFAFWGLTTLVTMVVGETRGTFLRGTPDLTVLGFTFAVSLVTGIIFGLVPALRATRVDLATSLKAGTGGRSPGARWSLARTLVVCQVALSLLLLVGAGLFVRTLQNLRRQDLGFQEEQVLEAEIDPRIAGYKPAQLHGLYEALLDRVDVLPGVRSASFSLYSPMSGINWSGQIAVEGYRPLQVQGADCQWVWVGPRYAETLGMTLLQGRDIGPQDAAGAPKVAVVNESFAQLYLANQNPVGRRFSMNVPAKTFEIEVVGVVKDFKFNEPRQDYWPVAFLPQAQAEGPESYASYLEVRSVGDPARVAASVRQSIQEVDKNLPVASIHTLKEQVNVALNTERLIARLATFFGIVALLLACIGLYGVLASMVAHRRNEIGIRMALGAQSGDILRMVMRETLLLLAIGLTIGLPAGFASARLISSQLYGLTPGDPMSVFAAALLLSVVAGIASYLPARRAMRVDPMVALRNE